MKIVRNLVAILAVLILLVLAFANAEPVRLAAFGYRTPELPLFIFLLVAFSLGYLLAALVGAVRQAAMKRQISRLERESRRPPESSPAATPAVEPERRPHS